MRPCSCCSPCPSEPRAAGGRGRRRAAALLAAALAGAFAAGAPVEGGTAAGTVAGTVEVWQATLRTDGPKHDLDVVVWLEPVGGASPPAVAARAEMDQQGLVFLPHVLAVEKGTTVTFLNSDHEMHNVYFLDENTGDTLDIGTWGPGVSVDHRFDRPGTVIALCKLHLEMAAYIVVLDGPWFTTVRLDPATAAGRFTIGGVPPGEYRLRSWHKKLRQKGGAATVVVSGGGGARVEMVITKAKYASPSR